jgi:ATP-dependent helicase/nuclease subunit A
MSRKANPEQLLAIEHQGGVLLRAGAGSGKTFVLVEHIIYLTQAAILEFRRNPRGLFEDFIRTRYSQIVMMTFTKKAAGEMSIRLTEMFAEKVAEDNPDQDFWVMANEQLPALMVTTIDGFCKKLISLGFFPHLSTESKIIFETERRDQVREFIEEWFLERSSFHDQSVRDIVIKEKKALLSAFTHVFSDPGLRLAWKKFHLDAINPSQLGKLLGDSFKLNNLSDCLLAIHSMEIPTDKPTSFEIMVASFQNAGLPEVDSVEKLRHYEELFAKVSRIDNRKKLAGHDAAKESLQLLRGWVKKWSDVVFDYEASFTSKILPWMNLCLDVFQFLEARLDPNKGMTFGDIEFFVSLGLENPKDLQRIQKTYQYFIVDEFQDTSDIQFRIIRNLLGNDFKKLFCVGDAKQAIYGFRGGELSVFQDCADVVPQVRSLAHNYRSLPEIIHFNNSLFRTLLPLGYNFEGPDPFSVNPEAQTVPDIERNERGFIEVYKASLERDLEVEGKFSNEDINRLEAIVIANAIKNERENSANVCTILYSKLRPSHELIRALMERKIGFTAQYKIDLLEDPIVGIFICLIKRQFDTDTETRSKYPLFIFKSYFEVLGISVELTEQDLAEFDQNVKFWGLVHAFRKFLYKLHITNENSDINLATIEAICELYHQDQEAILNQIGHSDNERLSLELRSGEESHMVQIMSAHASKGLEFDAVYLAGIYTNGREQTDGGLFGDLPGSFNWFVDLTQKTRKSSPLYVFENEIARYKNFSEAKRLFYVACTRAKKKLSWVDFDLPDKTFLLWSNCWISGLRRWMETSRTTENIVEIPLENFNARSLLSEQTLPQLPLFFHDPVGIYTKGAGNSELLIAAELSVTRINNLLDCPRKFYFSSILKIPEVKSAHSYVESEDELALMKRSSTDRGTYIHELISRGIKRNFIIPREVLGTDFEQPVEWALNHFRPIRNNFDFLSEKQFKFKFFNFMISGIPDLILLPKVNDSAQVWDFKTGRITQDNLTHYWLQLSVYAYALYELSHVPLDREIVLILCFVDQEKLIEERVTYEQCLKKLYPIWRSQNEPWITNLDHCSQCSYGSICPR